jgi:hypothetical protein
MVLYGVSILLSGTALLLTVASSQQAALILVSMDILGFVAIRKLGYGRLRRASASQVDVDARRHIDRLAAASDEEHLRNELKGAAQAFEMTAIRMVLVYRNESDSVTIQREHGDWGEAAGASGGFEAKANSAAVKVEFRSPNELGTATVEGIRQAIECACARIFGKPSELRVAR